MVNLQKITLSMLYPDPVIFLVQNNCSKKYIKDVGNDPSFDIMK